MCSARGVPIGCFDNGRTLRARYGDGICGIDVVPATTAKPSGIDAVVDCVSDRWGEDDLWVPVYDPMGYPVHVYAGMARVEDVEQAVKDAGLSAGMEFTKSVEQAAHRSLRAPQVLVKQRPWLKAKYSIDGIIREIRAVRRGDSEESAVFRDFMESPVMRTEVMWARMGAYPWSDLDALCEAKRCDVDPARVVMADELVGLIFSRATWAKACAYGDSRLWKRDLRFKQRHYYDVVTLLRTLDKVYRDGGDLQRFRYRAAVKAVLRELCGGSAGYERIYLTVFWLFTSQYWPTLCAVVLRMGSLRMPDADYVALHKETTAVVTQTWMLPFTCHQHPMSAAFFNAENLTGWSDADMLKGDVACEVLEFAVSQFKYVAGIVQDVPEHEQGEEYLRRFRTGMTELLEPMYRRFGPFAKDWDTLLDERMAWMAGGAVGRRARDVLGPSIAPTGCAKAYAASRADKSVLRPDWGPMHVEVSGKTNERGAERTLLATDLRDQIAESHALHMFRNKYGLIGIDIGESPVEAMARHLNIAACSRKQRGDRVLAAWDYAKWDHYIMHAERAITVQVMYDLTDAYVTGKARLDMLRELEIVRHGQDEAIFRSRAFMVAEYRARVDAAVESAGGRAVRTGGDTIRVREYSGQLSGRRSTLESNTFISRARLAVRDRELRADARAEYRLNRADDVLEIYKQWTDARDAIDMMLAQGHRANPKKQVIQERTGVYFRTLYANGSMRGFPARAVYAAATAAPLRVAEATEEAEHMERIRSLSAALDRLARRGSNYRICRALYAEAEAFHCNIKLECYTEPGKKRRYIKYRIPTVQMRAAAENGGCGVLPPGEYEFDMSWRVRSNPGKEQAKWKAVQERLERARSFRGLHDLAKRTSDCWQRDVGVEVPDASWRSWHRRWRANRAVQDGKMMLRHARWQVRKWSIRAITRKNKCAEGLRGRWSQWMADMMTDLFNQAWISAEREPGGTHVHELLSALRGPPAEGMLSKLWWGLGQDVLAESPGSLSTIVQGTVPGRQYLNAWSVLPGWIHELFLLGKLGPAGDWMKLVPSSWSPLLHEAVNAVLYDSMARGCVPTGNYQMLLLRQEITGVLARAFVRNNPLLSLH